MNISKDQLGKAITNKFLKNLYKKLLIEEADRDSLLENLFQKLSKKAYFPQNPDRILSYDKGNGVLRFVPILSRDDYLVYMFCISAIDDFLAEHRVEGTYGGWSLSCAMRRKETDDATFFDQNTTIDEPSPCSNTMNKHAYIQHFGEYNAKIKEYIDFFEGKDGIGIAKIDIANFYDSIRLDILEDAIRETVPSDYSEIINCLFFFLKNWNKKLQSYKPQTVGIPQEYIGDCSRILSNFYLQKYDLEIKNYCEKLGGYYLRYADDQIFIADKEQLRQIIAKASYILLSIGLNINAQKVKVFDSIDDYKIFDGFDIKETIDPNLSPAKQSLDDKNNYTEIFLETERAGLPKKGFSLAKIIIHMGISSLNNQNRASFIKVLLDEYINELYDERLLKELKEAFTTTEWELFLDLLIESIAKDIQNIRRFELLRCGKKLGIDTSWILEDTLEPIR